MDLNNLRKLSQKWHDDTVKLILQKCAPQEIAQELVSKLQAKATTEAEKGEYEAMACFVFWSAYEEDNSPLGHFNEDTAKKASEILFKMIQEQVKDKDIQLELIVSECLRKNSYGIYIEASVKW